MHLNTKPAAGDAIVSPVVFRTTDTTQQHRWSKNIASVKNPTRQQLNPPGSEGIDLTAAATSAAVNSPLHAIPHVD
ncbi:hypothetical protein SRHO_G00214060 [Serrasalmus rhombeus]